MLHFGPLQKYLELNCFDITVEQNSVRKQTAKLIHLNKFPLPHSFQLRKHATSLSRDLDMQLEVQLPKS